MSTLETYWVVRMMACNVDENRSTYLDVDGALLVGGVADGAVLLDDNGVAAATVTHARHPTVLLGEALGVAEHQLLLGISIMIDSSLSKIMFLQSPS